MFGRSNARIIRGYAKSFEDVIKVLNASGMDSGSIRSLRITQIVDPHPWRTAVKERGLLSVLLYGLKGKDAPS